jgi:hypothetical protein
MPRLATLLFAFILNIWVVFGQTVGIEGFVKDSTGAPVTGANVYIPETRFGTVSDNNGYYSLTVKTDKGKAFNLVFSYYGFEKKTIRIQPSLGKQQTLDIILREMENMLDSVEVSGEMFKDTKVGETKIDPKNTAMLPSASGNAITDLIKTLPGVNSNNELTSQYTVRGGNFDENLIYVNDFEIYRPLLVTNSLQEGLSFINADLTQGISFNAGGFESKYGDRMSSVLNIRYKRPTKIGGSATMSLLGASAHLEGATKDQKFMFLFGMRYKSNAYLLGSLDLQGEYDPRFLDIQSNMIWKTSKKTELEVLVSHSNNTFSFVPKTQSTTTGAFNQVLRLTVFFEGNQKDFFRNTMGGLAFRIIPNTRSIYKFVNATWKLNESENFNITGEYFLDEIEANFDSDNFGKVKRNLGIGTFQDWARNSLEGWIYNTGMRNSHSLNRHTLEWGGSFQQEFFDDRLSEWERIDSAGFSIPYGNSNPTILNRLKSELELNSYRVQAYVQDEWKVINGKSRLTINAGARIHYWSQNKQIIISPRAQLYYKPATKKDLTFKFAAGHYAQPPLYREIRDFDGVLNPEVRAQRSWQFVLGSELNFMLGKSNFKFTSEAYYKHLLNINPYEVEDVRVRYFADNNARGYAAGIDMRLFGEFVRGTDSWISFSYLNTKEDISNDFFKQYFNESGELITGLSQDQVAVDSATVFPGYIRRPSDQRFNISIFFQDYLVKNKNFKMHMQLQIGSGLPYGPPDRKRYNDVFKMPPYRRFDIGFSYLLVDGEKQAKSSFFNKFDKIWLSAEVLNLLGVQNTLSYRWVKDVTNVVWPLPNYLTSRRFNVKLYVKL